VSLLVLADLSAGFDTVNRYILMSVLASRFSIASTALTCRRADRLSIY